jgi:hypothetical protein
MNHRIVASERSRSPCSPIGDRRQDSERSLRVAAEWSRTTGVDSLRPHLQILVATFPALALSFSHHGEQPRLRFSGTRKHFDRKHFSIDPIFWVLFVRSSFASLTNPQRHSRSFPKSHRKSGMRANSRLPFSTCSHTPAPQLAPLTRLIRTCTHSNLISWIGCSVSCYLSRCWASNIGDPLTSPWSMTSWVTDQ